MALIALQQAVNAPIGSIGAGVSANAPIGAGVLGQGTAVNTPTTISGGPSAGVGGAVGQLANLGALVGLLNGLFSGNQGGSGGGLFGR